MGGKLLGLLGKVGGAPASSEGCLDDSSLEDVVDTDDTAEISLFGRDGAVSN